MNPACQGTNDFLAKIARSIGRLKKGSVPDYNMAALHVLRDWTDGSIPYYTLPPEVCNPCLLVFACVRACVCVCVPVCLCVCVAFFLKVSDRNHFHHSWR